MLRILISLFFIAHGLVHLLGFAINWRYVTEEGWPYRTSILGHHIDVGDMGTRAVGLLWFVAAVGYVMAGVSLIFLAPWWFTLTIGVTALSILVSVLSLPEARYALLIDAAILLFLYFDGQFHWIAPPT